MKKLLIALFLLVAAMIALTTLYAAPKSASGIVYDDTQKSFFATVGDKLVKMSGLPLQTGNGGKYLTTDGVTASWGSVAVTPPDASATQSGLVNTTTQTFGGNKTFNGSVALTPANITAPGSGGTLTIPAGSNVFYTSINPTAAWNISVNESSLVEGQQVTIAVVNSNATYDLTITTWTPSVKWRFGTAYNTIFHSTTNIYTLVKINSIVYVAAMDQMQ